MHIVACFLGIMLCFAVVLDAFQTIILPRRPTGRFRPTRLFYLLTWTPWTYVACRLKNLKLRDQLYSIYGPLSLLLLLVVWAVLLITGFALIYLALHTPFSDSMTTRPGVTRLPFWTDLYVSGTTLTTLGLGDVVPIRPAARVIMILEAGMGLGFVALVVGYLPVLYTAFSRREVAVALLDARAGSPPTAAELLKRHAFDGGERALTELLAEWERWAAELLESHVSYPLLCYYRSQHDNQSWLAALVTILDTCALLIATVAGDPARQAQLTFAMARHAIVDLGHIFHTTEKAKTLTLPERLPAADFERLCMAVCAATAQQTADMDSGLIRSKVDEEAGTRLAALRAMYEPNAQALANYLALDLPQWIAPPRERDPWHKVASLRYPSPRHVSENAAALHHDGY